MSIQIAGMEALYDEHILISGADCRFELLSVRQMKIVKTRQFDEVQVVNNIQGKSGKNNEIGVSS